MALTAGLKAFQENMVTSDPGDEWDLSFNPVDFHTWEARRVRYAMLWAMYESTVYRDIHTWAVTYKTRYALYKYIRNIYNPSYRLGEFWKTHLWGGSLEQALPIEAEKETLKELIRQVWLWSNFSEKKDIYTLYGSVLGDVIIRVVDDVNAGNVHFEYIPPGNIVELVKDDRGNVKGYTLVRAATNNGHSVEFKEVASRDGNFVVYRTYLNNTPFDWGNGKEWAEPYGFVPMVHIQHNNVGGSWGWSELHPSRSKLHEVDDVSSIISDHIRKTFNSGWLFTGVQKDRNGNVSLTTTTATTNRPQPGREEEKVFYATDPQAKAIPLVANMDYAGALKHIADINKEIERDYPELRFDNLRAGGDISGESLRVARQPVETKVMQRRANYDNALVRLNQMALSIGGYRGYFSGISLESYSTGALQHSIGNRPVFYADKLEKLTEEEAFWKTAQAARAAGIPLLVWLRRQGWNDEEIKLIQDDQEFQARQELIGGLTGA